ncbi:MAG: hypothetical protein ACI381_03995 [Candidatus Methanomethylophilaceae archaeon]
MGKIKLPDEIEKWEKKSLREDIGSEKEHTHTIYVYKNIAIEHEHDCGCDAWNPYVLVDGHPFKLHSDYFHNFDEALGYIKGALKEKELLDEEPDEDDEPEEPEFPKAKVNDMSKSFVMPTAREMFAEAHALPDMYELAKSREMHKQQMREFFDAQKGIDRKTWKREEAQAKEFGTRDKEGQSRVKADENSGKYLEHKAKAAESGKVEASDKKPTRTKTPEEKAEDERLNKLLKDGERKVKDMEYQKEEERKQDLIRKFPSKEEGTQMDNGGDIGQVYREGETIETPYQPSPEETAAETKRKIEVSGGAVRNYPHQREFSGLVSEGVTPHIKPEFSSLSGTNTDRLNTSANLPSQTYTPEEKQALVDDTVLETGQAVAPGAIHGTSIVGYDSYGRPLYPANTNADKKFFGKGGFNDAVALWNQRVAENQGIPGYTALPEGIRPQDLSLAALKELYANWYMITANAPVTPGQPPQRLNPTDMGQLNLLGGINFENEGDLFDEGGNMNGLMWTLLQNGRKWDQTPTKPIKTSNGWLRLTDNEGNNFMRGRSIADPDIGAVYESIKDDPVAVSRMFNSDLTLGQLANLRRTGAFTPQQLNMFTGFRPYSGAVQKSFREIMEERIQKADAEAGIPSGYIGMHPHKAAYKTVWLGYGKDATYPFVLKNALTGEKVCEVSDIPRDERKD